MRAAHDGRPAATTRLHSAARMASAHGRAARSCGAASTTSQERVVAPALRSCPGLLTLGRSHRSPRRSRTRARNAAHERYANGAGYRQVPADQHHTKGEPHDHDISRHRHPAVPRACCKPARRLIRPEDPGYDEARAVYNGDDRRAPGGDRRCRDSRRRHRLRALRAAPASRSPCAAAATTRPAWRVADGALVIDLSLLRSTTVDPDGPHRPRRRRVHLGEVDHATVAFGMATPSGSSPRPGRPG